ncbi:MAG: diol dehydratase reactivase ATPase-like domain-containing protein [Gaiellales bacterium]
MLVAGVDVGNSTTELAVASLDPGGVPEWRLVLRAPTTGLKGSVECAAGVSELLGRAERRLGERPHRLLLSELHPVEAGLVELGRMEELDLARTAIARPASATPSGEGVAVGVLRPLAALAGESGAEPVLAVVAGADFEQAAAILGAARSRGWKITGVLVEGDDAVLIGNRFDRTMPIVDEVTDAARLPFGALAAIEVAPAGGAVEQLSDPLRTAALLGLPPDEARAARHASRAVAGHRAAVVVRGERTTSPPPQCAEVAPIRLLSPGGQELPFDERADPPAPGSVRAIRGAAGDRDRLLDVAWCPLPSPPDDPGFSRRLASRRAVAVALLAEADASGLVEALAGEAAGGVEVVGRESEAAVLGASTTPGAGHAPFVLDIGGGTVDLHREHDTGRQMVVTAGAGDLVTRICAGLLACDQPLAERAKRVRSAWVETPFTIHHEDGTRAFLGEPAPSQAVARLCALDGRELRPLPVPLAPEVWRGLRRAAKRDVIGRNVRRALAAAGGVPRGELVTLVGGSACDPEVVDAVAVELTDLDVAVARGDVLGRHGPRAAVAVGLVLAYAGRDSR